MALITRTREWLVDRLGLAKVWRVVLRHPVPAGSAEGKTAWMYVFGDDRPVDSRTYRRWYRQLLRREGRPYSTRGGSETPCS